MISPERLRFLACVFKNRGQNDPKMPTAQQRTEWTFLAEALDGWRRARVR